MTAPPPDQLWAAIVLCLTPDMCSSVLAGRPVHAGNLDGVFLTRALRGESLPDPDSFILITPAMLAAVHEAGSIVETWRDLPAPLRPRRAS